LLDIKHGQKTSFESSGLIRRSLVLSSGSIVGCAMNFRKIALYVWLILIAAGLLTYFFFPVELNLLFTKELVGNYLIATFVLYYVILVLQGIIFIPSPLIFIGILIFNPIDLLIVNMAGLTTSAIIIYYFSKYLKSDVYFETKYSKYIDAIKDILKGREFRVIVFWSFLPMLPTNLIVYVSSVLRINTLKCVIGVFIGESLINIFYIVTFTTLLKAGILHSI
jgi:uncharacterized membrane protein YdjX (TVP38/TMEM64 family)